MLSNVSKEYFLLYERIQLLMKIFLLRFAIRIVIIYIFRIGSKSREDYKEMLKTFWVQPTPKIWSHDLISDFCLKGLVELRTFQYLPHA